MMRVAAGAFVRPLATEDVAGDACLVETWARGVLVAATDGLGHGPPAAAASSAFMGRLRAARSAPLAFVLEDGHRALLKTRGAVAAVARFDELAGTVEVAGLGNVTALLASGSGDAKPIVLPAGVLGSAFRPVRPQVLAFGVGDVLVLHTDGVQGRLALGPLRSLPPEALARAIVDKYGKASDDAGCAVAVGTSGPSLRPEGSGDASTTLAARAPADAERCATEARGFAGKHGFTVMAQWQLGIAVSELVAAVAGGPGEGRVTLSFVREPRESIMVEVRGGPESASRTGAELASVHRMMDRVALEPGSAGIRVVAYKYRG
jgi:anti-sigma regulatory factor (Ser/Thr protein kinase)